jgi:hypothetical protein
MKSYENEYETKLNYYQNYIKSLELKKKVSNT